MTDPGLHVVGLGDQQHVPADRVTRSEQQLLERLARAEAAGAHVWITAVAYALSEEAAHRIVARTPGPPELLDTENLLTVNQGCYRCEEPLNARTLARRCRGEATP